MSGSCFTTRRPFLEDGDAAKGRGHIWQRPDLSEQSDGAGEASHADLGAQRERKGRQGGEGRGADG